MCILIMENGVNNNSLTLNGNARRKAAANASINLTRKYSSLRRVRNLLRKRKTQDLSEEDEKFLLTHGELVKQFYKRREKRAEILNRQIEYEDSPEVIEEKCLKLAQAIHDSQFLVVYTGAGISTAASIPDYRGPNGIWTRLQKGKDIGTHDLTTAEPTLTHMALSLLYHEGITHHIVSQNCDGLHLRSGLPKTALSELHGNMYIEVCKHCVPAREYVRIFDVTEKTSKFKHTTGRRCYRCGEPLIDTIVHFGERGKLRWPLNWQGACQAANACDTILCLGSSLKVLRKYPWLWQMDRPAKKRPQLYVVNLQWTPKDKEATLKINGKCDEVMALVMKYLGFEIPDYVKSEDPIFNISTSLHPQEASTVSGPSIDLPTHSSSDSSPKDCLEETMPENDSLLQEDEKCSLDLNGKFCVKDQRVEDVKRETGEVETGVKIEESFRVKTEIKSEIDEEIKLELENEVNSNPETQTKHNLDLNGAFIKEEHLDINDLKVDSKTSTKCTENGAQQLLNHGHITLPRPPSSLSKQESLNIMDSSTENDICDIEFVDQCLEQNVISVSPSQFDPKNMYDGVRTLTSCHSQNQGKGDSSIQTVSPKERFYGTGLCVRSSDLGIQLMNEESFEDTSTSSQYSDTNSEATFELHLHDDKEKSNSSAINEYPSKPSSQFDSSTHDQSSTTLCETFDCKESRVWEMEMSQEVDEDEAIQTSIDCSCIGASREDNSTVLEREKSPKPDKNETGERSTNYPCIIARNEDKSRLWDVEMSQEFNENETVKCSNDYPRISADNEDKCGVVDSDVTMRANGERCAANLEDIINLSKLKTSLTHSVQFSDGHVDRSLPKNQSNCVQSDNSLLPPKVLDSGLCSGDKASATDSKLSPKENIRTKNEIGELDLDMKMLWYKRFCGNDSNGDSGKKISPDTVTKSSTEFEDDVKRLWFWGFDSKPAETSRRVTRSSYQKTVSDFPTTDNHVCGCLTKNSQLCQLSREDPKIPILDEDIEKARKAVRRRRQVNYKRFESYFQVKLESVTFERKKIRRSRREEFVDSEEDPDGESEQEEDPTTEAQRKTVCESKLVPGWYGKGYRKFVKRKKSYP